MPKDCDNPSLNWLTLLMVSPTSLVLFPSPYMVMWSTLVNGSAAARTMSGNTLMYCWARMKVLFIELYASP